MEDGWGRSAAGTSGYVSQQSAFRVGRTVTENAHFGGHVQNACFSIFSRLSLQINSKRRCGIHETFSQGSEVELVHSPQAPCCIIYCSPWFWMESSRSTRRSPLFHTSGGFYTIIRGIRPDRAKWNHNRFANYTVLALDSHLIIVTP